MQGACVAGHAWHPTPPRPPVLPLQVGPAAQGRLGAAVRAERQRGAHAPAARGGSHPEHRPAGARGAGQLALAPPWQLPCGCVGGTWGGAGNKADGPAYQADLGARPHSTGAGCLPAEPSAPRPPAPPALPSRHRMPPPSGPAPPPAVAGLPRLSQADVLVCARGGGGLLKERMALARTLWEAGIAAELLPQTAPSLTDQYEYAQSRGIPWLVIIHASTFGGEVAWRGQCQGWAGDWSLPLEGDGLKLPGIPLLMLPIFAFRVLVIHWKQTVPAQRPFSCCGWAGMREGPSAHFAFP